MTYFLKPAQFAELIRLLFTQGQDGKAGLADEKQRLQAGVGLDFIEGHGPREGLPRLEFDADPLSLFARLDRRVGISRLADRGQADHRLVADAMIDENLVALGH